MDSESLNNVTRVLLVDDEEFFLETTHEALSNRGYKVVTAQRSMSALEIIETQIFDVVVLDIKMPGMDGLELLRKLKNYRPTLEIIMLTGHATVPLAVEAMKLGAFDFLLKPCSIDEITRSIDKAARIGRLERRTLALEMELERTKGTGQIVGASEGAKKIFKFIERASSSDLPVLITGESGTGKELVARAIHNMSRRSGIPLVVVDGATLREELLASELFGHERGAFTGAVSKKIGLFEVADRGSIFLDEIGEMSMANQAALLRVIETGRFRPVGSVHEVSTNVRIIAATNKNLADSISRKAFREDLYYRLKGHDIAISPLRDRKDDIPLLAKHFLKKNSEKYGINMGLSDEVLRILVSYEWPGNVRELMHVLEQSFLEARDNGNAIEPEHLPGNLNPSVRINLIQADSELANLTASPGMIEVNIDDKPALSEFNRRCEANYISRLLGELNGNKTRTAKTLGISRSVLYEKLRHRRSKPSPPSSSPSSPSSPPSPSSSS